MARGGDSMKMRSVSAQNQYMKAAIEEAYDGITKGHGGPFGTVIVKDGKIVGKGHNQVIYHSDPTCHGEIAAIRDAAGKMKNHDLTGCELYTTGEPCPMCLYACLWAKIDKVYYGCTIADNAMIGFRDEEMDKLGAGREQLTDFLKCIDRDACLELFKDYQEMDHTIY